MDIDTKTKRKTFINWMIRRELSDVIQIENLAYGESWSVEQLETFKQSRNNMIAVIKEDDLILGSMFYSIFKDRYVVVSLAVHPEFQRSGYAKELTDWLKKKLRSTGKNRIQTCLRETNLSGQLFLKAQGFTATEIIRNNWEFEDGSTEDGYIFEFSV